MSKVESFFTKWERVIKNTPLRQTDAPRRQYYASEQGGKRIDAVAKAVCRAQRFAFCEKHCIKGCEGDDERRLSNGSFAIACAAVVALDNYDDERAADQQKAGEKP